MTPTVTFVHYFTSSCMRAITPSLFHFVVVVVEVSPTSDGATVKLLKSDSLILVKKQTHKTVEQTRDPRSRSKFIQSTDL